MPKKCEICKDNPIGKWFNAKTCENQSCISEYKKLYFEKQRLKDVKKYSIPKVNEKRSKLNKIYEVVRIEVLTEAKFKCFIVGCNKVATTVEHLMKRKGFADDWARDNNIPLLIDKRYLRACCLLHNGELETNPELSKEYQYSNISGKKKSDL